MLFRYRQKLSMPIILLESMPVNRQNPALSVLHRCRRCGDHHEQMLEVQLMAPLITMLEEAAQWVKDGHAGPARATGFAPVPLSWEWLTIAVFSCGSTSIKADSYGVVEETVVIANE